MEQSSQTDNALDTKVIRKTLHERAICVIIPTYNNVGTIAHVVKDALNYCNDVYVVDDGSNDGTHEVLANIQDIHLVSYPNNKGKGHALKRGFTQALKDGFAYAITMDADGQHLAKDIPSFLEANKRWPGSLILGKRNTRGVTRSAGSKFANNFANFWFFVETLHAVPDTQTGFRLYPLKKLYGYKLLTSRYEAELELIVFASWHGVKIHSIPVDVYYPPKEERVSHFRPGPDFFRISVLNTVLCCLAIIYGLPLFIYRTLATLFRTFISAAFFAIVMLFIVTPFTWIYVHCGKMSEKKKWNLHLLMYRASKFVTCHIGIPGIRFSFKKDPVINFDTPSVIICNHQSHLDLAYLLSLTPKLIFLTNDWVWNDPFYGFLIRHAEYYPASQGIDNLIPKFRSLVERGYSIAIFPEGTRSIDCHIGPFHKGAFYVADELGIGITPMMLYGTGRALKKKTHVLKKSPVYLEVDKPYTHDQLMEIGDVRKQTKYFHRLYISHFAELSNKIEQDV
jgi:1-acyl-sn-glycerol-3-phosphate acyltransferase